MEGNHKFSEEEWANTREAIERTLNQRGCKKAEVGVEGGKIVVLEVAKRKVV